MVVNPLKSYPVESYHDRRVEKLYSDINMNKDREADNENKKADNENKNAKEDMKAEIVWEIARHHTASHFGFLERPGALPDEEMTEEEKGALQKITPEDIDKEMRAKVDSLLDQKVRKGIKKSIVTGLKRSIGTKCWQYEKVEAKSPDGKKLKKDLGDEIALFKKYNQKEASEVIELETTLIGLESNIKRTSKLFEKCPSIFHLENKIVNLFLVIICGYTNEQLLEIRSFLKQYNGFLARSDKLLYNKNYIAAIEERILRKQNEGLNIEIWKPEQITKKSFKERVNLLAKYNPTDFKFENLIYNADLSNLHGKGIIRLNEDADLIITSKNNYYLISKWKNDVIGQGTSKIAYMGWDLSKNKPIAACYLKKPDAKEKDPVVKEKAEKAYKKRVEKADKESLINLEIKGIEGFAKVKDYLISKQEHIFISDLYVYGNLEQALQNKKSKDKILKSKDQIGRKIIKAVHAAAQKGIYLPDLKPLNIYADAEGNPFIGDLDPESHTFIYCAPEIFSGRRDNEASVIWSLGITLYEIYCGKKFFNNEFNKANIDHVALAKDAKGAVAKFIALELSDKIIQAEISKRIKDHPEDARFFEIIESLLKIKPEERLSFSELENVWESAMDARKPVARIAGGPINSILGLPTTPEGSFESVAL